MGGPITHVVLTYKIFDKFFSGVSKKEFFIGTLFPDIQKFAKKPRSLTHDYDIQYGSLQQIKKLSPFKAGLKFHSILDIVRESFVISNQKYKEYGNKFSRLDLSIKALEDMILYSKLDSQKWDSIIGYLSEILPAEEKERSTITKWHSFLAKYFAQKPSIQEIAKLYGTLTEDSLLKKMIKHLYVLKEDSSIIALINDLYNNFEDILSTPKYWNWPWKKK